MSNGITHQQFEVLEDAIGESGACNDNDCSCHSIAHIAADVLNGIENYEYFEEVTNG